MRSISPVLISRPSFEQLGGERRVECGLEKVALMLGPAMKHRTGI